MAWLHAVIDVPTDRVGPTADFWAAAFGWPAGTPWDAHPELRSFEPPLGRAYLHLQDIGGPPGVTLDGESGDAEETVRQATDLGAELVDTQDEWRTLRSPGGLPFCVVRPGEHDPPEPVGWPGGHRTRMVQVCVDSPISAHDAEVSFWRAFLPGRWVDSGAREF